MKRAAIYVRVSTEEQKKHGLSVDAQLLALQDYCKNNHYTIAGIYNDAGISARKSYKKRPALLKMIDEIKAGNIDIVLFTKLDRFFRSVSDYYECIAQMGNTPWRAIWEDYETETSSGMFKVNIMLSVAQSEADRTSERIKSTYDYKRAKNEYVGGNKAPLGYMRDGKKFIKNPDEQAGVEAFFANYLITFSQLKAIDAAKAAGLKIHKRTAQRMIYHPAYYGALPYCQDTYISIDEHETIEKAKKAPSRANNDSVYRYIFTHLCKCGHCGGNMSGHSNFYVRKDGTKTQTITYICGRHENHYTNCPGSSIREPILEDIVIKAIDKKINSYNYNVKTTKKKTDAAAAKKIISLKQKQKRLKDLYLLGDIEFLDYKAKRDAILNELEQLQKEEPTPKVHQLPKNWIDIYNALDAEHKNAFLVNIISFIEITGMRCDKPKIVF